jgi:uncharacterized membrane protein
MAEETTDSTVTLFVGRYPSTDAAMEDYHILWGDRLERFSTVFDAAVVERTEDGSSRVVRKVEIPTRMGGWAGFLAGAALTIVFPPAILTVPAGAAVGALAGHFARGLPRADVEEIGDVLVDSQAALVVVVASSHAEEVRPLMGRADHLETREVDASAREIDSALDDFSRETPGEHAGTG